ncbi:MAG: double zinc ribbon domain-containing protein, partial [Candidatus Adiutrix sp.]|nr:double zinc ribbon domain-containing protein [Candidatus Adiutrix sp.]
MSRSGTFLSRSWRVARAALADLLWPPVCAVCPRALPLSEDPGRWTADFCPQCLATVELLPPEICPVCGRPFYHSSGHLCGDCLTAPPPFKTARAAAVYRGAVARSIGLLKYHGDLAQVRPLARLAA